MKSKTGKREVEKGFNKPNIKKGMSFAMRISKSSVILAFFVIILLTISACASETGNENENNVLEPNNSGENEENNEANNEVNQVDETDPEEKVTITIAYQWGEDPFNIRYKPIEDLLGNVEIEYIPSNATLEGFEEMFTSNIKPDIIVDQNVFALQDLDVIYPLDDLLEQIGFDIEMLDSSLVDSIRAYDDEGRTIGLPDGTSNMGLYYNKEVFDMFGEDYPDPEVPMTWPEVMDLARRMTAERNDVQYIGLAGMRSFALDQFAPNRTDAETGEVLVNKNEAFKKYFDLVAEFYDIPGMREVENFSAAFSERRAAMILDSNMALSWLTGDEDNEDIDLVPLPVWPERPNIGPPGGTTPMVITNYSENKEMALKVLEAYYDPEIILKQVREGGTVPPVADPDLHSQYGADHELYEGKNLSAYTVLERAVPEEQVSRWDGYVDIAGAEAAIKEGEDVVTVLRQLEEESEAKIAEAMATQ